MYLLCLLLMHNKFVLEKGSIFMNSETSKSRSSKVRYMYENANNFQNTSHLQYVNGYVLFVEFVITYQSSSYWMEISTKYIYIWSTTVSVPSFELGPSQPPPHLPQASMQYCEYVPRIQRGDTLACG
jgi:hypothetical protein